MLKFYFKNLCNHSLVGNIIKFNFIVSNMSVKIY